MKNIRRILDCVGLGFVRMLTITTGNTGRRITIPKNPEYRRRSERFTTSTMEWTDTEV